MNFLEKQNIDNFHLHILHQKLEDLAEPHSDSEPHKCEDVCLKLTDFLLFGELSEENDKDSLSLSPFENNEASLGNEINDMMFELMASQAVHPVTKRSFPIHERFDKFIKHTNQSTNAPKYSEDSVVPGQEFDEKYMMMVDEPTIFKGIVFIIKINIYFICGSY